MAKVSGVDVLVELQTGTDSTTGDPIYTVIGGQSGATLNREANIIEVTSKDGKGWAENITGIKSWSVECEGYVVVDNAGLDALETAFTNGDKVHIKIALPNGDLYEGDAVVGELPFEFPQDDAITFSTTFTGTGALVKTEAV